MAYRVDVSIREEEAIIQPQRAVTAVVWRITYNMSNNYFLDRTFIIAHRRGLSGQCVVRAFCGQKDTTDRIYI